MDAITRGGLGGAIWTAILLVTHPPGRPTATDRGGGGRERREAGCVRSNEPTEATDPREKQTDGTGPSRFGFQRKPSMIRPSSCPESFSSRTFVSLRVVEDHPEFSFRSSVTRGGVAGAAVINHPDQPSIHVISRFQMDPLNIPTTIYHPQVKKKTHTHTILVNDSQIPISAPLFFGGRNIHQTFTRPRIARGLLASTVRTAVTAVDWLDCRGAAFAPQWSELALLSGLPEYLWQADWDEELRN